LLGTIIGECGLPNSVFRLGNEHSATTSFRTPRAVRCRAISESLIARVSLIVVVMRLAQFNVAAQWRPVLL
jgi:hypothetical protein